MTYLTPSAKLLGGPAFIPSGPVILHNQRIGKVVVKSKDAEPQFLYWLFMHSAFRRHMAQTATGSTVRHTSPSRIKDFVAPIPPLPEQREIAAQLAAVDAKLAAEESRRVALAALFQSLLHHLMTGKVRLPDFAGIAKIAARKE
jgi:type I restriction enzyme, S subunit